jgi:hypothetical protein
MAGEAELLKSNPTARIRPIIPKNRRPGVRQRTPGGHLFDIRTILSII